MLFPKVQAMVALVVLLVFCGISKGSVRDANARPWEVAWTLDRFLAAEDLDAVPGICGPDNPAGRRIAETGMIGGQSGRTGR